MLLVCLFFPLCCVILPFLHSSSFLPSYRERERTERIKTCIKRRFTFLRLRGSCTTCASCMCVFDRRTYITRAKECATMVYIRLLFLLLQDKFNFRQAPSQEKKDPDGSEKDFSVRGQHSTRTGQEREKEEPPKKLPESARVRGRADLLFLKGLLSFWKKELIFPHFFFFFFVIETRSRASLILVLLSYLGGHPTSSCLSMEEEGAKATTNSTWLLHYAIPGTKCNYVSLRGFNCTVA